VYLLAPLGSQILAATIGGFVLAWIDLFVGHRN